MPDSNSQVAKRVEHTPGPWCVDKPYGEPGVYVSAAVDTSLVAKLYESNRPGRPIATEANARLIAAAPLLYNYVLNRSQLGDVEATQLMEKIHATRS